MCVVFRGGPHSSLMFCTNGVLLRMLTSGDGLEGITHIVVDEIHERDKFADFLLIMLRDLLPSKPHLHLVLMSATLNVALFQNYFHGCPLIQVPGYTYPVQVGSTIPTLYTYSMAACCAANISVDTFTPVCVYGALASIDMLWHYPVARNCLLQEVAG